MQKFSIQLFLIALLLFTACSDNDKSISQSYKFKIDEIVDEQILSLKDSIFCKELIRQDILSESTKINKTDIIKILESIKEFNINKSAYKNSFNEYSNIDSTTYINTDKNSKIKSIKVWGTVNKPDQFIMVINDKNNLFEINKVIEWYSENNVQITTIKKIKGLEKEEFKVKIYFNSNCSKASSIDSTGI